MKRLTFLSALFALACSHLCGTEAVQPLPQSAELRRWFSMVKEVEDGLARGERISVFK